MSNLNTKEQIKALRNRTTRPERDNAYWTPTECDLLRAMFAEGSGITEIALSLMRSETAVMQQILKMDLLDRQTYPLRCKKKPKYRCLCEQCKLPKSTCPKCGME